MADTELLSAALYYASLGWYVFPCKYGKKTPLTEHGDKDATTSPEQIRQWWTRWPQANVAVALEPSGLQVLDVDVSPDANGHAKPGAQSLAQLLQHHPDQNITHTIQQKTGRGGMHYFYQRPLGMQPQRVIGWRPGIDCLSRGYAVLAPSMICAEADDLEHGVKPSLSYTWHNGTTPVRVELLPQTPLALRSPAEAKQATEAARTGKIPAGERHAMLTKYAVSLRDMGSTREQMLAFLHMTNHTLCVPPIEEHEAGFEIAKIVDWAIGNVRVRRDLLVTHGVFDELIQATETPQALKPKKSVLSIEAVRFREKAPTRYLTGYENLDTLMRGGLRSHGLSMIHGDPGAGKTAFVLTMARQMCEHTPVYFISTELQYPEIVARLTSKDLDTDADTLISADEKSPLLNAMEASLLGKRIHLTSCDDLRSLKTGTLPFIRQEITRLREMYGVTPIVIVDYLQQIQVDVPARTDDRTRVALIAETLADMARELGCAILATGQTSRAGYGVKDAPDASAESFMGSAKHSGDIEYHTIFNATLRTEEQQGHEYRNTILYVSKQRMAPAGKVAFRFQGRRYHYEAIRDEEVEKSKFQRGQEDEQRIVNFLRLELAKGKFWTKTKLANALPGFSRRKALEVIDGMLEGHKLEYQTARPNPKTKAVEALVPTQLNGSQYVMSTTAVLEEIVNKKPVMM